MRIRIEIDEEGHASSNVEIEDNQPLRGDSSGATSDVEDVDAGPTPALPAVERSSPDDIKTTNASSTSVDEEAPATNARPAPRVPGRDGLILLPDPATAEDRPSDEGMPAN